MMEISLIQAWATTIPDRPGELARVLAPISSIGARIEFVSARRSEPGKGIVYIAPLESDEEQQAARRVGFEPANMGMLRLAGMDGPDIATALAQELLAQAQINLRGAAAVALERRSLLYLAFDSLLDAERAAEVLERAMV